MNTCQLQFRGTLLSRTRFPHGGLKLQGQRGTKQLIQPAGDRRSFNQYLVISEYFSVGDTAKCRLPRRDQKIKATGGIDLQFYSFAVTIFARKEQITLNPAQQSNLFHIRDRHQALLFRVTRLQQVNLSTTLGDSAVLAPPEFDRLTGSHFQRIVRHGERATFDP